MRRWCLVVLACGLAGCAASVLGADREGIWFREPFIGGSMQSQAEAHCAQYGKRAVLQGRLEPTRFALPVVAYNCV